MRIRALPTVLVISAVLLVSGCSTRGTPPAADGGSGPSAAASDDTVAKPSPTPTGLDLTSSTAWKTSCKLTEAQVNSALASYLFTSVAPQNYSVSSDDNECYYKDSSADSTAGFGIRIQKYGSGTAFGTSGETDAKWTADSSGQGATSACAAYGLGALCQSVSGGAMVISAGSTDGAAFPDGNYFYTFTTYGITRSSQLRAPAQTLAADLLALGPIVP